MSMPWPTPEALSLHTSLPAGVRLRAWSTDERNALPARLSAWYPTVAVGAESVFLDPAWFEAHVVDDAHPERDVWAVAIEREGEVIGFQAFEREPRRRTLHGRLGVLAPEARTGFLGALGFVMFEALGALMNAELLMVWVTLAGRGQQAFAERRGFQLCGLVPGFDVDRQADGRELRVTEALFTRLRCPPERLLAPADEHLTRRTREVRDLLFTCGSGT